MGCPGYHRLLRIVMGSMPHRYRGHGQFILPCTETKSRTGLRVRVRVRAAADDGSSFVLARGDDDDVVVPVDDVPPGRGEDRQGAETHRRWWSGIQLRRGPFTRKDPFATYRSWFVAGDPAFAVVVLFSLESTAEKIYFLSGSREVGLHGARRRGDVQGQGRGDRWRGLRAVRSEKKKTGVIIVVAGDLDFQRPRCIFRGWRSEDGGCTPGPRRGRRRRARGERGPGGARDGRGGDSLGGSPLRRREGECGPRWRCQIFWHDFILHHLDFHLGFHLDLHLHV